MKVFSKRKAIFILSICTLLLCVALFICYLDNGIDIIELLVSVIFLVLFYLPTLINFFSNERFRLKVRAFPIKLPVALLSILLSSLISIIPRLDIIRSGTFSNNTNYRFSHYFYVITTYCIIGPVFEELIFRGLLFRKLEKHSLLAAVLIPSCLFGILHFTTIIPLIGLGIVYSYATYYTNSIYPSIIAHITDNLIFYLLIDNNMLFRILRF